MVASGCLTILTACGSDTDFGSRRSGGSPSMPVDNGVDDPPLPDADADDPPMKRMNPNRPPPPADDEDDLPLSDFVDPGCPDELDPVEDRECDPLAEPSDCGDGMGCFPFVDYPDDPCAAERFGSRCQVSGLGTQGDDCTLQGCASGFLCVATGQGTQCAKLCEVPSTGQCPPGLICGTVDIQGYGVCF